MNNKTQQAKNLKAARTKRYTTYQTMILILTDFSTESMKVWRKWNNIFKMLK